jgi:type IV secretion system protein VirB10
MNYLCVLLFAAAAMAAEIPQGAHVLLRMENSLNTRTAQKGDFVYLRTAVPIADLGAIAVPAGSYVQGVVTEAKRSGHAKGRAQLAIRLETLTLASGKVYKFAPHLSAVDAGETGQKVVGPENTVEQPPSRGQDAERIAILAGSGAGIGGLADRSWKGAGIGAGVGSAVGLATVLLTRGKDVELRQGSTLDVVFDRPVSLE